MPVRLVYNTLHLEHLRDVFEAAVQNSDLPEAATSSPCLGIKQGHKVHPEHI